MSDLPSMDSGMAHTFLLDPHVSFPSSTFPSGSKSSATFSLHAPLGFLTHVNYTCLRETWVRSLGWKMPWRRERLPAPVFWPGKFYGVYSPWGHKESDMTERLSLSLSQILIPLSTYCLSLHRDLLVCYCFLYEYLMLFMRWEWKGREFGVEGEAGVMEIVDVKMMMANWGRISFYLFFFSKNLFFFFFLKAEKMTDSESFSETDDF